MFPWNIAKSAEAMFSRWAVKHVLKFFLKKKLGKFILGDIDLDQLEVQLGSGSIQLTDLALNVDYINQKLGSLPVVLKEGSIGSLLAKIPWKVRNCQIEVDELELVCVPSLRKDLSDGAEPPSSSGSYKQHVNPGSEKFDHESFNSSSISVPLDVHEGVKTIAKMVKWLLTSFHVKVKKLIVAYDPYSNNDSVSESHRALVLRISELEYGTCVSEENNGRSNSRVDSLLGLSRLTNFVKFQGAVVEFLQMDDVENRKSQTWSAGTSSEWSIGGLPSDATTPILTGDGGGFSGNLKLSIPWRNGSLDIHKVDIDVSINPIDLRLQPSTITWIFCLWQSLKNVDPDGAGHIHENNVNSVYFSSASQFHYSTLASAMIATDRVLTGSENISAGFFSQTSQETPRNSLLRGSHVIPDWVALSTNLNQNDKVESEPDLSASIDQFFECFDGLRTSHSALGNSGILNWTCSVFSAITAASTLASGSLLIPSEQQPVETNFKASLAGISVELYLCDKDQKDACNSMSNSVNNGQNAHHLGAKCEDLLLVLQIRPRETKFEATVKHIELDDYFNGANEATSSGVLECGSTIHNQSLSIHNLQAEVQDALPASTLSQELDCEVTHSRKNNIRYEITPKEDFVKMKLLQTSSVTPCQLTMKMALLNGSTAYSTSFSLKLPPFIFWVNFNLVNKLLNLLKQIENSISMANKNRSSGSEDERSDERSKGLKSSCPVNMKGATSPSLTTSSSKGGLRGSISLSDARIILCFPLENYRDLKSYSLWNQFIVLDITRASSQECFADPSVRDANLPPAFSDKVSGSIYLNVENLKLYLIAGSGKDVQNMSVNKHTYFPQEILSVIAGTKCFSCIGVLWQDGPVTGPWVAMRARGLATSQDSTRSRTRVTGKGSEFASVTTMGDQEDISSCTQEMILSSTFLLHIHLPSVSVNLTSCQYQLLHHLLCRMMDDLSHVALNASSTSTNNIKEEVASTSQTSFLVECNSLEVLINLDKLEGAKHSLQTELPGSWHKLKFHVQRLELLSVSNIGGSHGSNFFWLGHGEGGLWGSIDELPSEELLLISCSDSTMCRGDGEGGNALSSGSAGTSVVCLSDPHILQSFTTVAIRGATIIAHGCRLDWSNSLFDFFRLPSETDVGCHDSDHKGSLEDSTGYKTSFVLNLLDVALSYEPWIKNSVNRDRVFESDINSYVHVGEEIEEHVACLVAASLLNLSNQTVPSSTENDFKIRLQDLGLLLCASSGPHSGIMYDVEYLHRAGYVKVGGEALVEAILRTNCKNGLLWELECCDAHINLDTCHDSMSGLVRLAAQLQQLFAPDLEESMVHLQSRWKAVQQVDCSNDFINGTDVFDKGSASSPSSGKFPIQGAKDSRVVGLMENICEDAFPFSGIERSPFDPCESPFPILPDRGHLEESNCTNVSNPLYFSHNVHAKGSILQTGSESIYTSSPQKDGFPKVIEGYYMSSLCTLPEISARNHSINNHNSRNQVHANTQIENGGWYKNNSLRVVDDHIPKVTTQPRGNEIPRACKLPDNNYRIPDDTSKARGRVLLKNIDLRWRMYGGSDWNGSIKNVMTTGCGRDTAVCLELTLSAVDLQYDIYPDEEVRVSMLSLSVQDFNLYDRSKDAPWKLVLGYYHSKDHPRESSAKAFKLDLEAVRPDPSTPLEEYRLRLALLPVLLHLDQDQLDFLICFFEGKESVVDQSTSDVSGSKMSSSKSTEFGEYAVTEEALLPFFQKFDIWPIVVRVDYSPRRVDLAAIRRGNYVQLVNLVPWKGIELQLKHVHAVGIYGWSSICETIVGEWLEDISHNQIHKFLRGLPPIRSMFTVGSGAAKLVSLPVKNYKKDHRLLKGIQRGAIAFLRSISLEAIGLGVHLAAGAHDILLQTEHVFTNIPPSISSPSRSKRKTNIRSNQPKDARQGIQQACESLGDGLGKSASALVGNPLKTYQRGRGAGSVLASAVCGAPSAALAPASATVRAVHCALLGVRNSLDPEHKKESIEKYMGSPHPPGHN